MPLLLETVVRLQRALSHLHDLEQLLSGVPEEMAELHTQYTEGRAQLDRLGEIVAEARATRRAAEARSEECNATLHTYQEQVNRVRTQREYSAILHEIDTVKETIRTLEDEALDAMSRQEEAEAEIATLRESFDDVEARYQAELEKWEAAKPGVAEQATALRGEVETLRHEIPRPSLLLFERVREFNRGVALATVAQAERMGGTMWHCTACNYNVRPQIVVEIRNNGSLIQCDSCKRILYFEESAD
jgi:predicted  nucleic acid-binding Zn-ribbon protein